jgi:SnoaL-like domain
MSQQACVLLVSVYSSPPELPGRTNSKLLRAHASSHARILRLISDPTALPEVATSERLARRWFARVQQGAFEQLGALVHEDIQMHSKVRPGLVIEGREAVTRFIQEIVAASLYEVVPDVYTPLDDERVIVEGRMRWIDEERVIRDDPVVWAMEFRDELVLRFVPARTAIDAETILLASP